MASKFYKKTLYPLTKRLEGIFQKATFSLLSAFNPRFNSFRTFGIPSGWTSFEGENVIDGELQKRAPPTSEIKSSHPKFQVLEWQDPSLFFAKIPFGIQTNQAATLTRKGKLVRSFTQQFTATTERSHKLFTFRKERCKLSIPHFEGSVLSMIADCDTNYYHWLFDVIPKLRATKPVHYYYVNQSKAFQKDSLKALGIPKSKIIAADKHPFISADLLIPVSYACSDEGPAKWAVEFVRSSLARFKKPTRRLYISREKAPMRRILNEDEVFALLESHGFERIFCEDLSFQEQIELFGEAEIIVSPHGAGLTNMIFAPPGTKIIELFSPCSTCICYWSLANILGFPYSYFRSIDDPSTYYGAEPAHNHLLVDLKTLESYLPEKKN
jgi:capsular polysaccharide biosynthesis protein